MLPISADTAQSYLLHAAYDVAGVTVALIVVGGVMLLAKALRPRLRAKDTLR